MDVMGNVPFRIIQLNLYQMEVASHGETCTY